MAEYPRPETTLAVILGASEFPKTALAPNAAFASSAKAFTKYLLEDFGLPKDNLLNLFDTEHSAGDVDGEIADFLEKRGGKSPVSGSSIQDVLLYYVGHGAFTDDGGPVDYFLAIRSTRELQKRSSGYLVQSLAYTLRKFGTNLRKYLILDCCFAAAAFSSLQSPPLQLATEQVASVLKDPVIPSKGTALFCAASKTEPAKAPPNCEYTMFSTALLQTLREGDANAADMLSFQQLGELVEQRIRQMFQDEAVRPQVNSPDQRLGDVAQVPFFPNPARNTQRLQMQIERLTQQVDDLGKQLAEEKSRDAKLISQNASLEQELQKLKVAPLDLRGDAVSKEEVVIKPASVDRRDTVGARLLRGLVERRLKNAYGLTKEQLSTLPEEVQDYLLALNTLIVRHMLAVLLILNMWWVVGFCWVSQFLRLPWLPITLSALYVCLVCSGELETRWRKGSSIDRVSWGRMDRTWDVLGIKDLAGIQHLRNSKDIIMRPSILFKGTFFEPMGLDWMLIMNRVTLLGSILALILAIPGSG